jgi:hypothetical protein
LNRQQPQGADLETLPETDRGVAGANVGISDRGAHQQPRRRLARVGLGCGIDAGVDNLHWSSAHYSREIDAHPPRGEEWWTHLALAVSVLGRNEFVSLREALE